MKFSLVNLKLSKNQETAINVASTIIKYVFSIGISFFLSPYIVKVLGAEANGFVNLSNNFISYFSIIIVALNGMATRFIAVEYHKGNFSKANQYYSSLFFGDLVLVAIFSIVSLICVWRLEFILQIPDNLVKDVKILFAIIFINYLITTLITIWNCATYIANKIYLDSIRSMQYAIVRALTIVILFSIFAPKIYYLGIAIFLGQAIINIYNCYYKLKLVPELRVKASSANLKSIKELISSGIWNSFSRAGGILETGLDLLLTNILIGSGPMGILSVSKSIPGMINELNYALANVFLPSMVRDYAKDDNASLVNNIKSSSKILSMICCLPLCFLIVYGKDFYALWQPTLDSQTLHILSLLACLAYVFTTGTTPLLNIFTTYNKVKQNSLAVIIGSAISAAITIIVIKTTDIGIYAVAGISSIITIFRFLFFVIPYSAKCLKLKWYTFYSIILQTTLNVIITCAVGFILSTIIPSDSWILLCISAALLCVLGVIISYAILLNKNEKLLIKNILKNRLTKRR